VKGLESPHHRIFVADDLTNADALQQTTHLGIGAHPDDLESIALPGILESYQNQERIFSGVTITDGAGAPRAEVHRSLTTQEFVQLRAEEQIQAAKIGRYSSVIMLGLSSAEVKTGNSGSLIKDLQKIIMSARPEIIYTHNPFDNHPTHIAVCFQVLEAIHRIPRIYRPKLLAGMELWGTLEWLPRKYRLDFDTSRDLELQESLLKAFRSQNLVKSYPEALLGRRKANAVLDQTHQEDSHQGKAFGLDLTPLIKDSQISIDRYLEEILSTFQMLMLSRAQI
jgi:LmbE family N-acetylglucosaminyl deacetylase